MKNATREQLVSTVKQLNRILFVDPAEAVKIGPKTKEDELKKIVIKLGEEIEATDFEVNPDKPDFIPFDADAIYTFEALNVLIPKKPAPVKKDEKGKKAPKAAAKKEAKTKYTRANAFADAFLSGETDCVKLITQADEFYVKNGGTSNIKEAKWYHNVMMPGLVALGIVSVSEGKLTVLKDLPK